MTSCTSIIWEKKTSAVLVGDGRKAASVEGTYIPCKPCTNVAASMCVQMQMLNSF